jgi:CRISPR-associated protein (TIGR03986 family)
MNDLFYNPYHFVPVDDKDEKDFWEDKETFFDGVHSPGHWSHQRYATKSDIYHGRILCKLTTETPLFVGAKRTRKGTEETSGEVAPYELKGDPAIPASSLRGVISSIAEAASNSATRVLEDRSLSYRSDVPGLSAIGMVFITIGTHGNKEYRLRPLAMPTLEYKKDAGYTFQEAPDSKNSANYNKMFYEDAKTPRLKVLVQKKPLPSAIDKQIKKIPLKTYASHREEYYYMNLRKNWHFNKYIALSDKSLVHNPSYKIKKTGEKKYKKSFCIGQRPCNRDYRIIPESEASPDQKKYWVRGIVRVLDTPNIEKRDLPRMRKHEIFIPYPEEAEEWPTYLIPDHVMDNFHKLADERTDATKNQDLPYEPYGTLRNNNQAKHGKYFRLKNRDIVYFKPDHTGEKVAEIALSAIWRSGIKDGNKLATVNSFFAQIDSEILPFNNSRKTISPAEMVFGFVDERSKEDKSIVEDKKDESKAYAGRVRFSHGIFESPANEYNIDPYEHEVTLKILDTPKPPSPALYFTMRNGRPKYIPKDKLNLEKYKPQGRKFYLHHRKPETDAECWKTYFDENFKYKNDEDRQNRGRFKQKVKIKPLKANLNFLFHVDFENLNDFELGMLCYALRPNGRFRHKIGMGKPLGLGTVRIDPLSICYIDRAKRYRKADLFNSSRYHDIWRADEPSSSESNLPKDKDKKRSFSDFRDYFRNIMKNINAKGIEALELIGDPAGIKDAPVQYPQVNMAKVEKGDDELEHFRWWEANKKFKKFLAPIDESGRLTKLPKHKFKKKDKD